jgi:hypothetical protein
MCQIDSKPSSYYTFSSFLGPSISEIYLTLPHDQQIEHFEAYLAYLMAEKVKFPSSKRATMCYAVLLDHTHVDEELASLIQGPTRSGFGVCGTPDGFLPQRKLSMGAARLAGTISHVYVVENAIVLNSRSFMFGWCHAEKQKLVDLYNKVENFKDISHARVWPNIILVVDRGMCADCIAFASSLAIYVKTVIRIQDPQCRRKFAPDGAIHMNDIL